VVGEVSGPTMEAQRRLVPPAVPSASSDRSLPDRVEDAGPRGGRGRKHLAVASVGWGPSGRRFKSCLPDYEESTREAGSLPGNALRCPYPNIRGTTFGTDGHDHAAPSLSIKRSL